MYKFVLLIAATFVFASCMKDYNQRYLYDGHYVEFEEATTKSNAAGKDYVVAAETVRPGKNVEVQVNLVSAPFDKAQIVKYRVVPEQTTAVNGTDYQIEGNGTLEFAAGTNIGKIIIKPTPAGTGQTLLVLELEGNELIKPSKNYKKIAVQCVYP